MSGLLEDASRYGKKMGQEPKAGSGLDKAYLHLLNWGNKELGHTLPLTCPPGLRVEEHHSRLIITKS